MTLQKLVLNGSETGATAGTKINAIIDSVNSLSTTLAGLGTVTSDIGTVSQTLSTITTQVNTLEQDLSNLSQALATVSNDQSTTNSDLGNLTTEVTALNDAVTLLDTSATGFSTDITELQTAVNLLLDTALLVYKSSAATVYSLTTTFSPVTMGDTLSIDKSNGHVSYDGISEVFDIHQDSIYSVTACGTISGAATRLVSYSFFVNGVSMFPVGGEPVFECSGSSDPLHVSCHGFFDLHVGDQVQVKAKIDVDDDVTFHYSSIAFKKEVLT